MQINRPKRNRPLPTKATNVHLLRQPPKRKTILKTNLSFLARTPRSYTYRPRSTTLTDWAIDFVVGVSVVLSLVLTGMCCVLVIAGLCKKYGPCAAFCKELNKQNNPKNPAPSKKKIDEIPLV